MLVIRLTKRCTVISNVIWLTPDSRMGAIHPRLQGFTWFRKDASTRVSAKTSLKKALIPPRRQQIVHSPIRIVQDDSWNYSANGRLNAQAAFLRGLLSVEGKIAALVMFQRCLPGPPGSTGRVAPISSKTVTAQRRDT